jgi:membrane-bound metal-dependent hydrolase YbcI (DUF457 family)
MDPITHGITGALLGKGFFSKRNERVAIFAATLGAVFPDIDTVADFVSRDPLAIVKYHRAITHSFVALPFFALLLAFLTPPALAFLKRRYPVFRGMESPSRAMLTLIYGIGIASHILLDGMTSFGTRMWYPISNTRVAWDLVFIIDLVFTSIVLLPQVIAWIYRHPEKSRARAVSMWICFMVGAVLGRLAASLIGASVSHGPIGVWVAPFSWSPTFLPARSPITRPSCEARPSRTLMASPRSAWPRCRFRRPCSIGAMPFAPLTAYTKPTSICAIRSLPRLISFGIPPRISIQPAPFKCPAFACIGSSRGFLRSIATRLATVMLSYWGKTVFPTAAAAHSPSPMR